MDDVLYSELGTEERRQKPYEGKSYAFGVKLLKDVETPAVVNEKNKILPLDDELATLTVNAISKTAQLFSDLDGLDKQVKAKISERFPELQDGVIPEGTVNLSNLDAMKEIKAGLNKDFKRAEDNRKSGKKDIVAPYDYINSIYQEKTSLLSNAIAELTKQIKTVEDKEDERKRAEIKTLILSKAKDYHKDLPELLEKYDTLYNKVWRDSFLNKTCSNTKMQEEVMKSLAGLASELKSIDGEANADELKISYFETGDLAMAIQRRQQLADSKALIKKLKCTGTFKSGIEQTEKKEESEGDKEYIYKSFRVWHTNKNAFVALVEYLKFNGFHAEIIKD